LVIAALNLTCLRKKLKNQVRILFVVKQDRLSHIWDEYRVASEKNCCNQSGLTCLPACMAAHGAAMGLKLLQELGGVLFGIASENGI
jgi:hypothetical protein